MRNQRKKPIRDSAPINTNLDKSLAAYVAVASAAGVGLLALAQPAEAKVVYTSANVTLDHNGSYAIDLNNDGVTDFELADFFSQYARRVPLGAHNNTLTVTPSRQANRAVAAASSLNGVPYAAALRPHNQVGPNSPFQQNDSQMILANSGGSAYSTFLRGPFITHREAYLGVKFFIQGLPHYGWVRITVSGYIDPVTVVGFAYETVPNKSISAGQTGGPVKVNAQNHSVAPHATAKDASSLGLLARGADGIAFWRRDGEVVAEVGEEVVEDDRSQARA